MNSCWPCSSGTKLFPYNCLVLGLQAVFISSCLSCKLFKLFKNFSFTLHENLWEMGSKLPKYFEGNPTPTGTLADFMFKNCGSGGRASRWQKSKTQRSPCSPQIHQKYIYMWNCSYRTPTECWQKTSDLPKGKKLPMYLGRAKEKRKKQRQRIGTGPAPLGGTCEGGKLSTH